MLNNLLKLTWLVSGRVGIQMKCVGSQRSPHQSASPVLQRARLGPKSGMLLQSCLYCRAGAGGQEEGKVGMGRKAASLRAEPVPEDRLTSLSPY